MTPLVQSVTTFLSLGTVIGGGLIIILLIGLFLAWVGNTNIKKILEPISSHTLLIAFVVSLFGVLGSLFYSHVAGFAPCELCWWQRIFFFPLPIILGVALWHVKRTKGHTREADHPHIVSLITNITLALTSIGGLIALYHSYGILVDNSVLPACEATGVSCSKIYFLNFGYVAIPTMSLTLFALLVIIMLIHKVVKKA